MIEALKISLCIIGIYIATRDDMIFGRPRAWIQTKMDRILGFEKSEWLQKPLFECQYCMSSFWSVVLSPILGVRVIDIPITILMVCGLIYIINLFNKHNENRF
jgi:hypothetical protein